MVKIDKELDQMEASVLKMGDRVLAMHKKIVQVLIKQDKEMELEIIQADERINLLEEEINDQAIASLALLSPVASDLRQVIAAIKIACELERIGDYAKNIAIFLIKQDTLSDTVCEYAQTMEKEFIIMLEETMQCYSNRDIDKAFEIPEIDKEINALMKETKYNLTKEQEQDVWNAMFEISTMLRNIERAGDHTKNICEHIIYMLKGQHYDFG